MTSAKAPVLTGASLSKHSLALVRPLAIKASSNERAGIDKLIKDEHNHAWLKQRDYALLILRCSDGSAGVGEIAPLPGFSRESLSEACAQAYRVVKAMRGREWIGADSLAAGEQCEYKNCVPSVQFALDMALQEISLQTLCSPEAGTSCSLKTLPVRSARLVKPDAVQWVNPFADPGLLQLGEGGGKVKIKVARRAAGNSYSLDADIDNLHQFVARYPGLTIRLDANRGWNLTQATEFLQRCSSLPVEFIEEPCRTLADNLTLLKQGWPVAIDETIQEAHCQPGQFSGYSNQWAACVIKPSLTGSLNRCLSWVDYCRRSGVRPIISSSFESPLGLSYIAQLALRWAPEEVHGLDTLDAFVMPDDGRHLPDAPSVTQGGVEWQL